MTAFLDRNNGEEAENVFRMKLMQRNLARARKVFAAECRKIREGLVSLDKLLFYKETRRLQDYALLPPHAFVSEEELIPGKRVAYWLF